MNNKKQLSLYVKAFILNLIMAAAAFAGFIILQGGLFSLAGDFDVQQIPFAMYANDAIRNGNVVWDWSLDLGSNFIGGMSFYILGNPSFWISMLFPSRYFMYAVGWIYVLKYGVAGLTSFAYMKRYVKDPRTALIGSMLYAFSGFMNVNLLFYHFHDVVALFPLMLLTLDGFVLENKKGPFIFAVFINAVTNYYFLIGEVIFLVAYYFLRYPGEIKKRLIVFGQALWEAVLGCMIGAALLLPSFFFVIQNPRVANDYKGSNSLVFSAERYLYILKGILFPAEIQSDQSAVISSNFSSCSAYLPMIGLTLVIAFFYYHEKHWLKNILKFSLVMTSVPVLNASFSLFAGLYHRWYYMPVLMMTLASAMMLDAWSSEDRVREERSRERFPASEYEQIEETDTKESEIEDREIGDVRLSPTRSERAIRKGAFLWGLTAILFIAFLSFVKWSDSEPSKIYRPVLFASSALISFGGIWLTWLIFSQFPKQARRLFRGFLVFFCIGTTIYAIALLRSAKSSTSAELHDEILTASEISYDTPEYRFTNRDNPMSLSNGLPQEQNFCSTVSGSIFRFYESLGLERDVRSPDAPEGLEELISAKYTIEKEQREEGEPVQVIEGRYTTLYIYKNDNIAPIGFTYQTYMTASEFEDTSEKNRAILMLKTLVIPDEEEKSVSEILRHYDEAADGKADSEHLKEISASHLSEASENVECTTDMFASTIFAEEDTYAFFSIPDDDGWTASVDGEEAEIIDVNGFMAVRIHAGENRIVFRYEVPGLKAGIAVTTAGAVIALVYLAVVRIKSRKRELI